MWATLVATIGYKTSATAVERSILHKAVVDAAIAEIGREDVHRVAQHVARPPEILRRPGKAPVFIGSQPPVEVAVEAVCSEIEESCELLQPLPVPRPVQVKVPLDIDGVIGNKRQAKNRVIRVEPAAGQHRPVAQPEAVGPPIRIGIVVHRFGAESTGLETGGSQTV